MKNDRQTKTICCLATTSKGCQCKNRSETGQLFCRVHWRQIGFEFDEGFKNLNDSARTELKKYNEKKRQWERRHPGVPFKENYPRKFKFMRCGAKTRSGRPCKRKDLYASGRCRLHGGLSTGPRTEEGKRRSAQNGFKVRTL